MKRILALAPAAAVALIFSSTAFANALDCGHGTCNSAFISARHGTGGTLPFTGLNLATVAVVAVLLIASGLALRWTSGRRS